MAKKLAEDRLCPGSSSVEICHNVDQTGARRARGDDRVRVYWLTIIARAKDLRNRNYSQGSASAVKIMLAAHREDSSYGVRGDADTWP